MSLYAATIISLFVLSNLIAAIVSGKSLFRFYTDELDLTWKMYIYLLVSFVWLVVFILFIYLTFKRFNIYSLFA